MRHFLFRCNNPMDEEYGCEFLVGEDEFAVARTIAENEFGKVVYLDELTEWDAENSGLDEW